MLLPVQSETRSFEPLIGFQREHMIARGVGRTPLFRRMDSPLHRLATTERCPAEFPIRRGRLLVAESCSSSSFEFADSEYVE